MRRVAAAAASPVSIEIETSLREIAGMVQDLERVALEPLDESPVHEPPQRPRPAPPRENVLDNLSPAFRPAPRPRTSRSASPRKYASPTKLWTSPGNSRSASPEAGGSRRARPGAPSPYLDRLQHVTGSPDLVPVPGSSSHRDVVDTRLPSKSEVDGLKHAYDGHLYRGKLKKSKRAYGSKKVRRHLKQHASDKATDYDRLLAQELANAARRRRGCFQEEGLR